MGHDHHHHHDANDTGNIKVAFFLNLGFTIIELVGGFMTNSVAILSDALHDLGDSMSLGLAWYFQRVSKKGRDRHYSYGYRRFSILGAVINSIVLIVGSVFILLEAIPRLSNPEMPDAQGMLYLAILGVVVNGFAAWRLSHGHSHNEKVVSLHMIEDVLGWVAVLIGALVMMFYDLPIIDPLLSIGIALFILYNVVKSLKKTSAIILQGLPADLDENKISSYLNNIEGVSSCHDMHMWTLDGSYHVLTAHLVLEQDKTMEELAVIKAKIRHDLHEFGIEHATIETETKDEDCGFEDC